MGDLSILCVVIRVGLSHLYSDRHLLGTCRVQGILWRTAPGVPAGPRASDWSLESRTVCVNPSLWCPVSTQGPHPRTE